MTITGYSNAIVDVMLGWLKGLANWVLRLFNLAGSATASPLLWLSQNWLRLLVFFLVLGVGLDILIWLIRWRPYWVWFRKERVIVNDDRFFENADMDKASDREEALRENWDEHDYVVASTVVKRQDIGRKRNEDAKKHKRTVGERNETTHTQRQRSTKVKIHSPEKAEERRKNKYIVEKNERKKKPVQERINDKKKEKDVRKQPEDNIFTMDLQKQDVSDFYEDEVFNLSNLPASREYSKTEQFVKEYSNRNSKEHGG